MAKKWVNIMKKKQDLNYDKKVGQNYERKKWDKIALRQSCWS